MRSIVWLRRDLRLQDHHALSLATRNSQEVALAFVLDPEVLDRLHKDNPRLDFLLRSLKEVHGELEKKGAGVFLLKGKPERELPKLARELKASRVFANEDYEPWAKARDVRVFDALRGTAPLTLLKDQVIFSGREVIKGDGSPYRVFTPYKNAWLKAFTPKLLEPHTLGRAKFLKPKSAPRFEVARDHSIEPGRRAALRALKIFNPQPYKKERDFPALRGTSKLSPHLRFGTLSVREVLRTTMGRSEGAQTYASEIIWREFYQMLLDQFPEVVSKNFQEKTRSIKWPGKKAHFEAWCEGQTGYPIVDAAMRQLVQTKWMHNRLRMIVASFLTKDLLVDWRKGEAFFEKHLLDYELASNNGGWQWAASTGCDAQPYFRVFHPTTQSQRFDPKGDFIRRFVPELEGLSDKEIHDPPPLVRGGVGYPLPLVDHSEQRLKAIALFKEA